MKLDSSKILDDLDSFSRNHFKDRPHFVCNYGSYANGTAHDNSDLDLFFATEKVLPYDLKEVTDFIIKYHLDNGLMQDEEVPYANKLVVSYVDLERAVKLEGLDHAHGRIIVPPIIKSEIFLASMEVRYRLLFNALTSPHNVAGPDQISYQKFKEEAEKSLLDLALNLNVRAKEPDPESLVRVLLSNPDGEAGEMFLGYKENPKTIEYLRDIFASRLSIDKLTA